MTDEMIPRDVLMGIIVTQSAYIEQLQEQMKLLYGIVGEHIQSHIDRED